MNEPTILRPGLPDCPDWLDQRGRETWSDIAADLWAAGTLDEVALPLLASYCDAYSRMAALSGVLQREGYSVKRGRLIVAHPAAKVRDQAMREMMQLGRLLGLTPLSRARLKAARLRAGR